MKIRIAVRALADLEDAAQFYEKIGGTALKKELLDDLESTIDLLLAYPHIGLPFVAKTRRYKLRKSPYFMIYDLPGDAIRIVALAHERSKRGAAP